jgi:NNP family nitrate/nitrite transporter-like MFS transporter
MGLLGMGNGAIFQIAPQRFSADIELITGIVGAAGGLGGFFLPSALGALKDISGSYGTGLLCFALLIVASVFLTLEFGVRWQNTWTPAALSRTRVFSYRGSQRTGLPNSSLACELDAAGE